MGIYQNPNHLTKEQTKKKKRNLLLNTKNQFKFSRQRNQEQILKLRINQFMKNQSKSNQRYWKIMKNRDQPIHIATNPKVTIPRRFKETSKDQREYQKCQRKHYICCLTIWTYRNPQYFPVQTFNFSFPLNNIPY